MNENCYTKDILYSSHIKKCIANCDAIPGKLFPDFNPYLFQPGKFLGCLLPLLFQLLPVSLGELLRLAAVLPLEPGGLLLGLAPGRLQGPFIPLLQHLLLDGQVFQSLEITIWKLFYHVCGDFQYHSQSGSGIPAVVMVVAIIIYNDPSTLYTKEGLKCYLKIN